MKLPAKITALTERLAIELHRQYRAAEKALNGKTPDDKYPALKDGVTLRHDHGWEGCHRQVYFIRRALLIIKRAECKDPETLGEAEQALDATVLLRRLAVTESKPLADGGFVTANAPALVGEEARDSGRVFIKNEEHAFGAAKFSFTAHRSKFIEALAAHFQVPERFITGNTGEARRKSERDAEIRKIVFAKPKHFVRTNAIAGPQTGRGAR